MLRIRYVFIFLGMLLSSVASAAGQVSVGIGLPNISIGINLPAYPELVVVPGYPVYYAPRLEANFFYYEGMYWVYQDDNWYESTWYNGPWWLVDPEVVPLFILRIPVRYYRQPPTYFFGWQSDAPPRWGDHWGHDWEQRRSGWDRWNRGAAPSPAPLPFYQRQYSGDRYPRQVEQQQELQKQNYRYYQSRDFQVQRHYQEQAVQRAVAPQGKPQQDGSVAPHSQPPQKRGEDVQRSTPTSPQQGRPEVQDHRQPPQPELDQREQQMPGLHIQEERQQGKNTTREPKRGQDRGRDRNE